ncbi:MAG: hypothetical protein ACOH2V_01965 [Candidatus Saccharimonadaceae bacterium]
MKTIRKILRILLKTIKWTLLMIVGLTIASALYNLTLPKKSKIVEYLSVKEKSFIAEEMNLQQKMGNEVWPGWGDIPIPVIVYNEKYAFLVGYPNPPDGWYKMPREEFRGTKWEVVETDDFSGKPYYRQLLPNPNITPENFTVKVGERWVVTMQTKEYAAVAFYKGFRNQLPPFLNTVFPYQIFWKILMGTAETHIVLMAHEAFHAYQGTEVPQRLADASMVGHLSSVYPWHLKANSEGWIEEMNLLMEAYKNESNEAARQLVAHFLEKRIKRREKAKLTVENIQYEQKREWLEGLALYAELTIGMKASENQNYKPVKEIETFSEFRNYKTFANFYKRQIEEVKRAAQRHEENRFYSTGMLQAVMLERLMPTWKNEAFNEDVYLEDLLMKTVNN